MFVTVVSIVGGSLLMATVGETSLRMLAGNAALDFICNRNLDRAFNALAVTAENKTFMFALGKTLDTVKDEARKKIKERATELLKTKEIKTSNPLVKFLEFDSLIRNQVLAANHAAEIIDNDRSLSDAKKTAAFAALEAAPICRPPIGAINSNQLAQKIELSIYLTKVLGSSELDVWGPNYGGMRAKADQRHADHTTPLGARLPAKRYRAKRLGPIDWLQHDRRPAAGYWYRTG